MADREHEAMRQRARLFRAERRQERIESLRRDFRFIAREAKLESDELPVPSAWVARESAVPSDFRKVMDGLGMCTPKALRVARNAIELWYEMDSKAFISVFNRSFFDGRGDLKSAWIESLILDFHASLQAEIKAMKDEGTHFVPLYKAMMKNRAGGQSQ